MNLWDLLLLVQGYDARHAHPHYSPGPAKGQYFHACAKNFETLAAQFKVIYIS